MIRYATAKDYQFVLSLILKEAANGHFARNLLLPGYTEGLQLELESVFSKRRRINGCFAYCLIWESKGRPIAFLVISALEGDTGNEMWLAAVAPEYRRQGVAKKMIKTVLGQFKAQGVGEIIARCAPESEVMYRILIESGFALDTTFPLGTRQLLSSW